MRFNKKCPLNRRNLPFGKPALPVEVLILGDLPGELGVAQVVRARRPPPPRVVALTGDLQRGAHLGDGLDPFVEQDESEPRPLRPGACSCLLARRALASESISLSLLSRSFPRLGRRRSSAIWKGFASASGAADEALLTQSARPDGSTPISRATSAQAVPLSLHGCTARRLNSAACFGHGFPMIRLPFPRNGNGAETGLDLSTDSGQIQAAGAQGPQGIQGETGPKGETGPAGSDGVSCTHSWNGTVLTVTSASGTSSADLVGPQGPTGETGATGPQGETGATGPQGPQGET